MCVLGLGPPRSIGGPLTQRGKCRTVGARTPAGAGGFASWAGSAGISITCPRRSPLLSASASPRHAQQCASSPIPFSPGLGEGALGHPRTHEFIENPPSTLLPLQPATSPPPATSLPPPVLASEWEAEMKWTMPASGRCSFQNRFGNNVFPHIPQFTLDQFPASTPKS